MTRRSKLEIISDILKDTANGVEKPTHLYYNSRVSWTTFSRILNFLIEMELIKAQKKGKRTFYKTTKKGRLALKHFQSTLRKYDLPILIIPEGGNNRT